MRLSFAVSAGILATGLSAAGAQAPAQQQAAGRAEVHTHRAAAGTRDYRLFVPAALESPTAAPAPLIVMLHGCLQDAADIARGTRLDAHAARAGAIVAYPQQPTAANPRACWNWYDPAQQTRDANEPALIAGIVRDVMASHRVDAARIYIGGISAGGAMAAIVAAAYPELFAAAASHSGVAVGAARSVTDALAAMSKGPAAPPPSFASRPLPPLLVLHGGRDAVVHPSNADALAVQWGVERAQKQLFAEVGHAWSGGSAEGTFTDPDGPDATALMVEFFLARRRAGQPR